MRILLGVGLVVMCASVVWAADPVKLNVRLGLWEVTTTTSMSGMPPIPADALAKLTPEQRARFEQNMKTSMSGAPKTMTEKHCETQEKLDKQLMFNDKNKECTKTVLSSSSSHLEMKMQCAYGNQHSEGTMRIDAFTPENVKGTIDMNVTGEGHEMKGKSSFTARWLSADCGGVK